MATNISQYENVVETEKGQCNEIRAKFQCFELVYVFMKNRAMLLHTMYVLHIHILEFLWRSCFVDSFSYVCTVQTYTKINSFKTNKHNLSWSLQKLDFSLKLIISFCKSFRHLHWIERSQTESPKINARTNFRIRSQVVRTSVKMSQQKL